MTPLRTCLAAVPLAAACMPAAVADISVRMLNGGPGGAMVFDPAIVRIAPGDSVTFVAADRGHNVESIKGMAPAGSPPVRSLFNQDETVRFDREGVYGFKCGPHASMGMVALVVVGTKLDNLEQAKSVALGPAARTRMAPLLAQAEGR